MNKFSLSGKIAIVTGGGRGIGRSIVDALADAGADIAVVGRKKGPLDEAVNAVEAKGRRAKAYSVDLRIVSEIRALVKDVVRRLRRPAHSRQQRRRAVARASGGTFRGVLGRHADDELESAVLPGASRCAALHKARRRRQNRQHHLDLCGGRLPALLRVLRREGRPPALDKGVDIRVGAIRDQR